MKCRQCWYEEAPIVNEAKREENTEKLEEGVSEEEAGLYEENGKKRNYFSEGLYGCMMKPILEERRETHKWWLYTCISL